MWNLANFSNAHTLNNHIRLPSWTKHQRLFFQAEELSCLSGIFLQNQTLFLMAWALFASGMRLVFHFVRNNPWISQNKVDLHTELAPLWDLQKLSLGKLKDKLAITWILLFARKSQHLLIVSAIKSGRRRSEFLLSDTEEVGEVRQPVKHSALWITKKYCFCGWWLKSH